MRVLLFLLMFPVAGFAGNYNYEKVISLNRGSDNFGFDKVNTKETTGEIVVNGDMVAIDGKKYSLVSSDAGNIYKSKKCSFELVYKGEELAAVKMFRSNSVICYVIRTEPALASRK